MQDSLQKRISDRKELTESEIESGVRLLGSHCQQRSKDRLRRTLGYVPDIQSYGIFGRVMLQNGEMTYCAGQSYPDEIRTVRECLIGR